ncbi:unnamed protein product [Microthlaspi erraticum]|uniref:Arabidopsis retrotransposon Orf1 C-terminal domain-containing protein n=1 Tax=Microthlaspi erraticum TaxID=1685480 RepID=A0A6D2J9S7_9BRAS|nr:unnamed protein product [Microthlaspi erraticum]
MEKVNIEPCVKMDTQTLDLLKIRDDVTWYIRKLGLSKLFKLECSDANGRISISALCQLFGLPNETAHDFKENSKRKQAAFADWTHFANEPFLPSRSKVSRITHPAIRYVHRLISTTFQCKQEANKLAQDLEGNKKLCVRFGRLITAIVQHVGIDIPNYEPLPKPTPLDLHALQHIHFLNRWTKDPTRFCYEFPIGPANTSLVLLPHEDIPSLRSACSQDSTPPPRTPCSHYWHGREPSSRPCNKLEKIVECQSRFISRLVRVVRHIAPERLFRPSSTAREPYEPDLGEFSLDSELGSEGDDPIDEEESSSHCHT